MRFHYGIWLKKILERGGKGLNTEIITFSFFLVLSFIFWYLNSLEKDIEYEMKYPVRYVNLPEDRVLADDLPAKLDLYLKGPGYSILKIKLAGNKTPVDLDMSSISYRRVPGSRTLSYYVVTSGLIPKLKNQLRAQCDITFIKPDTLFFSFDRIVSKDVAVVPDVEVVTERQYLVKGKIAAEPDTVNITGPRRMVDTLKTIRTRFRRFRGVSETITKSIAIDVPDECSVPVKKVMVTIPVEQFTEAEFQVRVKILNSPDTINVRIFPDNVTVKCMVAVSDYKRIKEVPFEVILDLAEADLGSSEKIPLSFRNIPPFISSLRVSPERVDFLIEKKLK
ncbi:MAG: CdaR family protein [Bacteroidales bacterium]|nr:CdaR family protein [Bacteroidales bacterium]